MKFCSNCGHAVVLRVPEGDNRLAQRCDGCGSIHYVNPRNVVGTIPVWEDKILICKRAIEPRYGFWTLPAGFMEIGETTAQAASRETLEEAGARVEVGELFSILNVPHVHQVHLFYLATLQDLDIAPGEESLEVKLVDEADVPWDDLAFPTVIHTLRCFFADRAAGRINDGSFRLHSLDIDKPMRPLTSRATHAAGGRGVAGHAARHPLSAGNALPAPHDHLAGPTGPVSACRAGARPRQRRARPARGQPRALAAAAPAGLPAGHLPLVFRRPAGALVEHRPTHGAGPAGPRRSRPRYARRCAVRCATLTGKSASTTISSP